MEESVAEMSTQSSEETESLSDSSDDEELFKSEQVRNDNQILNASNKIMLEVFSPFLGNSRPD